MSGKEYIWIQETWVQQRDPRPGQLDGDRVRAGETDVYEAWATDKGELFRSFQKKKGRCTGFVYIDRDGKAKKIGWVFEKRRQFDDVPNESFLMKTWVVLHKGPPTEIIEYHYDYLG